MNKSKKVILEILSYVAMIIVVILIKTYIASPIKVNGNSMYKTLHDKDIMILNEYIYYFNDIKRLDIVVVKEHGELLIKRVIGLPGETLKYENNTLYINGQEIDEKFLNEETEDFELSSLGYDKIPRDCYFVVGDNRDNSRDSRMIGCVTSDEIQGKASLVIYPFKNAGYRN